MENILKCNKSLGIRHNVMMRTIDALSGKTVSVHQGHNSATNSILTGIGHYLKGDGILNQGYDMLHAYVPQFISLGTMGLLNQEQDENGLPTGIGVTSVDSGGDILSEEQRFIDYMNEAPGFGADGYDENLNNNRKYFGLGPPFAQREVQNISEVETVILGDINGDGMVDDVDYHLLVEANCGQIKLTERQMVAADVTKQGCINCDSVKAMTEHLKGIAYFDGFGTVKYARTISPTVRCELISDSYPRSPIAFRDVVPEYQAQEPKTIDVIFSAMISTGALAQFREKGKDYIFITEAGLWSTPNWVSSGDNGLLAGYRIGPPDQRNWDMTDPANREILRHNILRVGVNQIVQVIWKIQLGAIEDFSGTVDTSIIRDGFYWDNWS